MNDIVNRANYLYPQYVPDRVHVYTHIHESALHEFQDVEVPDLFIVKPMQSGNDNQEDDSRK